MNRFFRKMQRDAERDLSYSNVFYRINTESQAKKVAVLCSSAASLIALFYFVGAWLMLSGAVPAPSNVVAVELLTAVVAAFLAWRLYHAPTVWMTVVTLIWLVVEFVRMAAVTDTEAPGAEMFMTMFVSVGFAQILGLRGARKLRQFQKAAAAP